MTSTPGKAYVHVRIDLALKLQAETIFRRMGMTSASGVRLLLSLMVESGQLPFLSSSSTQRQGTNPVFYDDDDPHHNTYTPEQIAFELKASRWKRGFDEP